MIETAIDGKKLQFYFQPTPVGGSGAKYTGPKLELLDRTYMPYGDYCAGSAPSVIPPDGFGNIVIGDSYSGWASGVRLLILFTTNPISNCSTSSSQLPNFIFCLFCRRHHSTTRSTNPMALRQLAS